MTADDVDANEATIANIRLWRPSVLKENFESVQRIRQYYDFNDVDVDRYELDGERRVLMVSGREVIQSGISQRAHLAEPAPRVHARTRAAAAQVNSMRDGGPAHARGHPPAGSRSPSNRGSLRGVRGRRRSSS